MRIVFMGTPAFALPVLDAVCSRHQVTLVVTQPPRPRGRGRRVQPSEVAKEAHRRGLSTLALVRFDEDALQAIENARPDAVVVAAFGRILPPAVLKIPRLGCVNVHPSLLPRYRGAAPIQRALMAGEEVTGVSVVLVTEEVDAGPILAQRRVRIGSAETAGELAERLSQLGAELLLEVLDGLEAGRIQPQPQDDRQACPAPRIRPQDEVIDWREPARRVVDRVRALNPEPGAHTFWKGRRLKVWRAAVASGHGEPGMVLVASPRAGLVVAAGDGAVEILSLQPEGRRAMDAQEFLRGYRLAVGQCLGQGGERRE